MKQAIGRVYYHMVNKHLQHYFVAQSFLTRLPVPESATYSDTQIGRSALYYPLVGLLIGLILGLVSWGLSFANPLAVASFVTILWVAITGALHLDGLADTADAWLGGHGDKERIFAIMKDPRSGTAGVTSICLLLILKVTTLSVLIEQSEWLLIILLPVIARLGTLALLFFLPLAKNTGLAYTVKNNLPFDESYFLLVLISIILLILSPLTFIFSVLLLYLLAQMMKKEIGGITGDTLGASIEIIESMALLFSVLIIA